MPWILARPLLGGLLPAILLIACITPSPPPVPDLCTCGWQEALDPTQRTMSSEPPRLPCVGCVNEVVDHLQLSRIIEITEGPVVICYTHRGCEPCEALQPDLEEFALARAGDVTVLQIDVVRSPAVASLNGVRAVPTLDLHIDGKQIRRATGLRECQRLDQFARWP